MTKQRYLTKSRFNLALGCPAKLFYTGKKEYSNQKLDDSFLMSLAEGGFQVGELAKCYFPGGHEIKTLEYDSAIAQTNELLKLDSVVIYEAAIQFSNLFIRADILEKKGNILFLYEVKAKSVDPSEDDLFLTKKGFIQSTWKPYIYDVAFQKYVIQNALPNYSVYAHLMMADKTALCPTNGLNQKFRIVKDVNGRKSVSASENITSNDLNPRILSSISVDGICQRVYSGTETVNDLEMSFSSMVKLFADMYAEDKKIPTPVSTACASCEFHTTIDEESNGLKSGKKECWKADLNWSDKDFNDATVLDVWNFRKKKNLLKDKRVKMSQIRKDDIAPKPTDKPGISVSERQWLQIEKAVNGDDSIWLDRDNFLCEMDSWVYPLHFIDFETTMVAIPFNAGRRPYEGIAFQFSHHVVYENGTIEHFGEYLNTDIGVFPSYDFVRELKNQLENDKGSIFRYSNHENTFLCMIYQQLLDDTSSIKDRNELCEFIKTITHAPRKSVEQWVGNRDMVDLWDLVKKYFYDPATFGSNSIKKVLPAILNRSKFLQQKYSKPIYGSPSGIRSQNFSNWQWIEMENGKVKDPYLLLPRMFQDISDKDSYILSDDDQLKDGGGALMAYGRMQFEEMTDYERKEIRQALLKYCELDTMAMVMIYEGWKDLLESIDN